MAIDFGKKFGFGTLRLPLLDEKDQTSFDYETLNKMVDLFLEHGFTYFDTSYIYHNNKAEIALRESLVKRHPRDSFTISTKLPVKQMTSGDQMETVFQEQLNKCGVDFFDYYLIHSINKDYYKKCKEWKTFEFLKQKREQGKFREFGVSLHDSPELLELVLSEHPEIDFVVLQINYVDWESPTIQSRRIHEVARKYDKPIVVMEPCKGGNLTNIPEEAERLMKAYIPDASIASWAIRYAASKEGVRVVLSSSPKMEFLIDNIATMENFVPLNEEEYKIIDKVTEIINSNTAIPCTYCRYCEQGCPKKIPIADCFFLFNDSSRQKVSSITGTYQYYQNLMLNDHGRAKDCVACRKCEKVCPQRLKITEYLKDVSALFDVDPIYPTSLNGEWKK